MSIATQIQRLQEAKADIKEAIENKGVAVSSSLTISDYAPLIDSIPTGSVEVESKDVDFYDYDGTRLYSYTKQEFLALTEMPANPTHNGLVAQGWNWSLSGAKNHLNTYDYLDIGQLYITNDGATRIYVDLDDENSLSPSVMVAINGSMVIDWGDGSTSNVSGTSTSTNIPTQHTYATTGSYIVRLIPQTSSTIIKFRGSPNAGGHVFSNGTTANYSNTQYNNKVKKIELGSGVDACEASFVNFVNMKEITVPTNISPVSNVFQYTFRSCISLKQLTLPTIPSNMPLHSSLENMCSQAQVCLGEGYTEIPPYATYKIALSRIYIKRIPQGINYGDFYSDSGIKRYICNPNETKCGRYRECYSLETVIFSPAIQTIEAQSFDAVGNMREYNFTKAQQVPTLANTNAFDGIQPDCKIVVPDSLYDDWIIATNWSNYASYIVKESEYVG